MYLPGFAIDSCAVIQIYVLTRLRGTETGKSKDAPPLLDLRSKIVLHILMNILANIP